MVFIKMFFDSLLSGVAVQAGLKSGRGNGIAFAPLKLTTLGEVDIDQAERAIEELQGFYSLDELVSFQLKHHRALDFKISFFAF